MAYCDNLGAMNKELERRLVERWPSWFNVQGNLQQTLMPFGFEHRDGWFEIVWRLCEQLEPLVTLLEAETARQFEVLQVKEKFGSLQFYCNTSNDAIRKVIECAELESMETCDMCGKPGTQRRGGWVRTRCDEHTGD